MAGPDNITKNLRRTTAGYFEIGDTRIYAPATANPTDPSPNPGDIYYNTTAGEWREFVSGTTWQAFGSGGSGITEAQHKVLRHLIHFIDDGPAEGFASGAYKEILPSADPFPTSVVWWESSSKSKKIVEKLITRSGGSATNVTPTPIKWKIYDTDGSTVLYTVSDAVSYSGPFETSRTRTITAGDA